MSTRRSRACRGTGSPRKNNKLRRMSKARRKPKGGWTMKTIERFVQLTDQDGVEAWRNQLFEVGRNLGYLHTSLAIFANRDAPIQAANAFLQTTLSDELLCKYDEWKVGETDPLVLHCLVKSTPLIWLPEMFATPRLRQWYEEKCRHGARAGIALPCHGPNGEFGILCLAADRKPDEDFRRDVLLDVPELSCFRDFIFETFAGFMRKRPAVMVNGVEITSRELECLKWCAVGKSSWDIAQLMNCTEATVNFHFANIRRKFGASSRRLAIVKAIRMGLISL